MIPASSPLSDARPLFPALGRRGRLIAAAVVVAVIVVAVIEGFGFGAASPPYGSAAAPAPGCPSAALVAETLKETVKKSSAAVLSVGAGPTLGSRLTCSYTTNDNTTIDYQLSSNANFLAIVAAEQVGFGTDMTFSGGTGFQKGKTKPVVIPAFAPGLVAWTLKQGGILDALYGKTNLLIIAPKASADELEALAKDTQGVPLPNLRVAPRGT